MQMHWMRLIGRSLHPRMTHPPTGNRQKSMGTHLLARAHTFRRKPEVELVIREVVASNLNHPLHLTNKEMCKIAYGWVKDLVLFKDSGVDMMGGHD